MRRQTGRVLPIDEAGRVLLLHGWGPARPQAPFWFSIGGGVDDGESTADAAAREAFEEVGLVLRPEELGPLRWQETTYFSFAGIDLEQAQAFYAIHVPSFVPVLDGLDGIEKQTVDDCRWWDLHELAASGQIYYPKDLLSRDLSR
jgi:8-oxo-dGTP pyrophosphatase MutT (NUDIX family)